MGTQNAGQDGTIVPRGGYLKNTGSRIVQIVKASHSNKEITANNKSGSFILKILDTPHTMTKDKPNKITLVEVEFISKSPKYRLRQLSPR